MSAAHLASSRLDELKKRYEENPRRFFAPLANEYRKAGDLDHAIALCQEHLGEQPTNMNGHVVYGQALYDVARYAESEATFNTALALDPENLIALRHLGDIARLNGNASGAVDWYKRVLDADPRNEEILAFIEELKAASAPPPAPVAAPAPPSSSVDPRDAARSAPTPVAPIDAIATVPPTLHPSAPAHRGSLALIDVEMDLGGDSIGAQAAPPLNEPFAPAAPTGDIELGALDFGDPAAAPEDIGTVDPRPPEDFELSMADGNPAPAVNSSATEMTTGSVADDEMGWDISGMMDVAVGDNTPREELPATETPAVFVTETMAELYLQQGLADEALRVYRQLAEANPGDEAVRDRIRTLESRLSEPESIEASFEDPPGYAPQIDAVGATDDDDLASSPPLHELTPIEELAPTQDLVQQLLQAQALAGSTESTLGPELDPGLDAVGELEPMEPALSEADRIPVPSDSVEPRASDALPFVASVPVVLTARSFFAALAQRRAFRPDGTVPGVGAVVEPPPRDLSAAEHGGSIDALFGASPDSADDTMGQTLATALEVVDQSTSGRGRTTQTTLSGVSLDALFRSESPMRASGPVQRQSQILNFDQFFAADDVDDHPMAPAASSGVAQTSAAPSPSQSPAPADDAQFQAWLQTLKGQ